MMMNSRSSLAILSATTIVGLGALALHACKSSTPEPGQSAPPHAPPSKSVSRADVPIGACPIAGASMRDDLIREGEEHFAHLWKVTEHVTNAAEGYWSNAGDRLTMQAMPDGVGCDRIFITGPSASTASIAGSSPAGGATLVPISNGAGVTTCSYFLPGDKQVLYASTHAFMADCPPRPDMTHGYVWAVHPEYDIYVHDLSSGKETALTTEWGYDAEATISPSGDRIVFTSSRSGDLELWTCDLRGKDLKQVTHEIGYDGGAYFSHDGQWLVFRASAFTPGKEAAEQAEYQKLLKRWLVRPTSMEIMVCRPDGSERRRVTNLGEANFAPYFFLGDKRIVFASNARDKVSKGRNFDLYAIGADGQGLEQITHDPEFDSFPMFSPDGKWLAFCSNRGGRAAHETNLFLAQWR